MKKKVINDPVYGFVKIQGDLVFKVIEHPYFQRLRRIKQLGIADYVYPGALHTRFHHAIGASHLMKITLDSLREKGHEITDLEYEATILAILLHDIGHGPLSHALENSLLSRIKHETISLMVINKLNDEFKGQLNTTIEIFCGSYPKRFLHQLVSSQLDIDRLDYLNRDSFFTGVTEGTVGAERIIKMFDVLDNQLVVEEKGIYSVENFLNSRRLMYWQVYFHKTSISAETMIVQLIERAKYLLSRKHHVFGTTSLRTFFENDIGKVEFTTNADLLERFLLLDDNDIWACIKEWQFSEDKVLSIISKALLNRKLYKTIILNDGYDVQSVMSEQRSSLESMGLDEDEKKYFFVQGTISNEAYINTTNNIMILSKRGDLLDVAEASDLPNIKSLSKIVKKHYLCYYKNS